MKGSKLLDSSIWLDYLHNAAYSEVIDSDEILFLSVLSIFEIKKKLTVEKNPLQKISESVQFIKSRSIILPINEEIVEMAVEFSIQNRLPAIDSLIYATAVINDAIVITLDNDFRGLDNAMVLDS